MDRSQTKEIHKGDTETEALRKRSGLLGSGKSLALVLILVTAGCLVILPRPTQPQILPLPEVNPALVKEREEAELRRARRARDGRLSNRIRAVGEQLRRAGLMTYRESVVDPKLMTSLNADAIALEKLGQVEDLRDLRALQTQLFIEEVQAWQIEQSRASAALPPSLALQELGGSFARIAPLAWFSSDYQLLLSDNELRLLFRSHWGKMTGLSSHPSFALSLEELRRYYLTLLLWPPAGAFDHATRTRSRLKFARALGRVDPNYPSLLAVGILELRLGKPGAAAGKFESFLSKAPNGPWSSIARNHLSLCNWQSAALSPYQH